MKSVASQKKKLSVEVAEPCCHTPSARQVYQAQNTVLDKQIKISKDARVVSALLYSLLILHPAKLIIPVMSAWLHQEPLAKLVRLALAHARH